MSGADTGIAIAVDRADNIWFTGRTCSSDFPASPHQGLVAGPCGSFVTKVLAQSNATRFAAVFGGGDRDIGLGITVGANGVAYVAGVTTNPKFPTSSNAFQRQPSGNFAQGFIIEWDDAGDCLHSTLLGSNGDTALDSIAVNGAGEVYVGGSTTATTFPGNGPVDPHPAAGIVAKLSPDFGTLFYARQVGRELNQIALFESVPAVSQAHIYTTGNELTNSGDQIQFATLVDDLQPLRIGNYWKPDQFINIEGGAPSTGTVGPGWLSAQWTLEEEAPIFGDPPNSHVFWIHSVWQPGQYLNIENGLLAGTSIAPGWLSARWTLERVPASATLYQIRNVWQPDKYLNIQSGTLTASPINPGWWSSMWSFERVY